MDPLTRLYERLKAQAPPGRFPPEPPSFHEWMEYWNDEDTQIGNLRVFEHWLNRRIRSAA
jgi:hypothetical protein